MRVTVLFFGVLKEEFGGESEEMELPEGSTVGDLLQRYAARAASRPKLLQSLAVAVNREYAGVADILQQGDEVALLPPVSGGAR
ncbi:MAG: MoaD/ThiS family protein [Edaphobacter sp.]|uniref:MoaD/ThiS family protein n=1 Tax=Edaphobacter sp. TaxID=1934404 RepID=UPI00238F3BEB|nr:MoaD/ThiS family protein [Edaphobacter sp.]MDE1177611.1 MoaD/ThiS family protein [Edaphobacter sp.]